VLSNSYVLTRMQLSRLAASSLLSQLNTNCLQQTSLHGSRSLHNDTPSRTLIERKLPPNWKVARRCDLLICYSLAHIESQNVTFIGNGFNISGWTVIISTNQALRSFRRLLYLYFDSISVPQSCPSGVVFSINIKNMVLEALIS
jgi:hypothetical protein